MGAALTDSLGQPDGATHHALLSSIILWVMQAEMKEGAFSALLLRSCIAWPGRGVALCRARLGILCLCWSFVSNTFLPWQVLQLT